MRQRTMLATLVEDWDEMTAEERRRVIGTVFAEIYASNDGIVRLLPREDWKPYMQAVLREPATVGRWVRSGRRDSTSLMLKHRDSFATNADGYGLRLRASFDEESESVSAVDDPRDRARTSSISLRSARCSRSWSRSTLR